MFCDMCGQQISQNDAFCWNCGAPVRRAYGAQVAAPVPTLRRGPGFGISSLAFGVVSLALTIVSICGLTFWIWIIGEIGWALGAAMLAFALGILGAKSTGRGRSYSLLGMYVAILALGIQAFTHFLWLGTHVDWTSLTG
jgi:hypothetical protein